MDQPISKRQRRLLTNASTRDKWRILRNPQLWSAAHLSLLIGRINELAESDPQESFDLAIEVLPPIFDRASHDLPPDVLALGYAALGQASRRLGRLRRADEFYDLAWKFRDLERSTWTKLHWQRAVLAMEQRSYARAERLAQQAVSMASDPTEKTEALIVRSIVQADQGDFAAGSADLRLALRICPADSDLQLMALGNLAQIALHSGSHAELSATGHLLTEIRKRLHRNRSRQVRKLKAHLNWTEGRVLIKLGVSGRIVLSRLRQAALGLMRLKFVGDALLCTADLLDYATEHNQVKAVLDVCQEVLALADELGAETHFEARAILQEIADRSALEPIRVDAFQQALKTAA